MAASRAPTRLARTAIPGARLQSCARAGLAHVAPTGHAPRRPTMSRMVAYERFQLLDRPINQLTRRQRGSCDEPSRPQSARGTARGSPRSSLRRHRYTRLERPSTGSSVGDSGQTCRRGEPRADGGACCRGPVIALTQTRGGCAPFWQSVREHSVPWCGVSPPAHAWLWQSPAG